MKSFHQKVAVITGAGSGIGQALALQLAREGARLALNDFNAETLEATRQQCLAAGVPENDLYTQAFDVAQKAPFTAFAEGVVQHFGQVDAVFNNAGVTLSSKLSFVRAEWDDIEWVMETNLRGVLLGSKLFLPQLLQRPEAALVNLSSLFGLMPVPGQVPYCTTKYAVRGLSESLYWELRYSKVTVTSVHPGGIKTNIARNARHAAERTIKRFEEQLARTTAEEAARIILKAVRKKRRRVLVGPDARFLGFFAQYTPRLLAHFTTKRTKKK